MAGLAARVNGAIVAAGLAMGMVASSAPAEASSTCPMVDSATGAVTPAPAPGVDWAGCNLAGGNLADANLTGANLSDANLTIADLTGATLTSANMTGAFLGNARLAGADLAGTDLTTAYLSGVSSGGITGSPASLPADWQLISGYLAGPNANLSNADLAGLNLSGAHLAGANLAAANLTGTNLTSAYLIGANLAGANLANAVMGSATLAGVKSGSISGTPVSLPANWVLLSGYLIGPGADLVSADLAGFSLRNADLQGAELVRANLANADLSGANLSHCRLDFATLTDANLTAANLLSAWTRYSSVAGAELAGATLTNVESGSITGTPASLPANWILVKGYLVGPGANLVLADLYNANMSGADLSGADLGIADLQAADLSGADLANAILSQANVSANLAGANLTGADLYQAYLAYANLDRATVTGATFDQVTWLDTTCPDGTNSNKHVAGCFSALDTTPPAASPVVTSGTAGANGWYTTTPVIVTWNWSDNGTIVIDSCPPTSGTADNGDVTLTGTCIDLAGNVATATYQVKVDTTHPVVSVTGVRQGGIYPIGHIPKAGCRSTDAVSGIEVPAKLSVQTSGRNGVGKFTATCSGAVTYAGTKQAKSVQVSYTVEYGFGGFRSPRPGSTLSRSTTFRATFTLIAAHGLPIPGSQAAALSRAGDVRVTLTGPDIKRVTATCAWHSLKKLFSCSLRPPAGVRAGQDYKLTAQEDVGTGFVIAKPVGTAKDPVVIRFS